MKTALVSLVSVLLVITLPVFADEIPTVVTGHQGQTYGDAASKRQANRQREKKNIARYSRAYDQSIRKLILHWANDDNLSAYARTVLDLGRYQTYLLSYGLPASDPRLVNRLASSDGFEVRSRFDYPVFAYRVFKCRLKQETGFTPSTRTLFESGRMVVAPRQQSAQH